MLRVEVWLKETSQPIIYADTKNSYEKGSFYCVLGHDLIVRKYPIANIWRVTETYGYGTKDQASENK